MANKMNRISPKIELINHFDSLINRVDIDIEQSLERYKEEQVLSQLGCFDIEERNVDTFRLMSFYLTESSEQDIEYQTVDEWSESTKVGDYLNQIRKRTIEELNKAQEESLEYYKLNSSHIKSNDHQITAEMNMNEIRSEMFKEKFYFQVLYKPKNPDKWIFNLFTFVTDFYMSHSDITLLETLINFVPEFDHIRNEFIIPDFNIVFDEKMVFIGLLQKHFFDNLTTQKFPSHVICVRKQEILNIRKIKCDYLSGVNLNSTTIDLSNLESLNLNGIKPAEIKIKGLSSLKTLSLSFKSLDQVILRNLFELRELQLDLEPINSEVLSEFIEYLPNIETLRLSRKLSYFSLDNLSNLKNLELDGIINCDFNFGLFDNLCNQLESISISDPNIDYECLSKLFYGRNFPYLCTLQFVLIKRTEFKFDEFPMLQTLVVCSNEKLCIINNDAFLNLKQLSKLILSYNGLENIGKNAFSSLLKLEFLDWSDNQLTSLDLKSFVGLGNLKMLDLSRNKLSHFDLGILDNIPHIEEINLSENPIINKQEIMDRFSSSKIKFIF